MQAEICAIEKAEADKPAATTTRHTSHPLHKKWSKTANLEELAKTLTNKAGRSAFIARRIDEIYTEEWRHLKSDARQATQHPPIAYTLQELVFSPTGDAPPKTRILEEFRSPVRAIQAQNTYVRLEQPRVDAKRRPPVASFRRTIPAAWIEVHLFAGG